MNDILTAIDWDFLLFDAAFPRKDIAHIIRVVIEIIQYVKAQGKEIRSSFEDSFRNDLVDSFTVFSAVN